MMKRLLISVAFFQFVAQWCFADGIYKCSTEAGVTYQSTPCTEGTTKVLVGSVPKTELSPPEDATPSNAALPEVLSGERIRIHASRAELQTGMLDLLVLNNRQWGKPQRITRSRVSRAWHEYWSYELGTNGGKRLHFVNGRLIDIEDQERPAPFVTASMVPASMMVAR